MIQPPSMIRVDHCTCLNRPIPAFYRTVVLRGRGDVIGRASDGKVQRQYSLNVRLSYKFFNVTSCGFVARRLPLSYAYHSVLVAVSFVGLHCTVIHRLFTIDVLDNLNQSPTKKSLISFSPSTFTLTFTCSPPTTMISSTTSFVYSKSLLTPLTSLYPLRSTAPSNVRSLSTSSTRRLPSFTNLIQDLTTKSDGKSSASTGESMRDMISSLSGKSGGQVDTERRTKFVANKVSGQRPVDQQPEVRGCSLGWNVGS